MNGAIGVFGVLFFLLIVMLMRQLLRYEAALTLISHNYFGVDNPEAQRLVDIARKARKDL